MRTFRLWPKKRGERRTGSPRVGSLGEGMFFAALFLLGAVALTALITSQVVNPAPEVWQPGFGYWLLVLVSGSFILMGGVGCVYAVLQLGVSAERRSAMVRNAAQIELIRDSLPSARHYPTIPRDVKLTDSPGIHLTYRLPIVRRGAWQLLAATLLCLIMSGFASILVVVFVQGYRTGAPDWSLLMLAVPYVVAGSWSIYYFLKQWLQFTRIGPTCVEISDHPLRPGGEYEIFLSQAGRLTLSELRLTLVCEEEATYHQGTDVRTERRLVCQLPIYFQEGLRIEPGSPLEIWEAFTVPRGAMHSFQSSHNSVNWKLVVRGEPLAWPQFTRRFPVLIYPKVNGNDRAETGRSTRLAEADHGATD